MNIRSYVWLITILLITGCKEKEHPHGDHNKSNIYMNRNAFDDLVKGFEAPDRASWQKPEEVIATLGDIRGKTVMDIGAGTGYFSFRMAARGATVIAADVDERFLEYIETKKSETGVTSVRTRKVPYDDPGLEENEADAVIIVDTYHHIENRTAYFRKVLNGLKPGGKLMVVDFKKEETLHGPPQDHRLQPDEVIAELGKAGFTAFKSNMTLLPYQYIIIALKKDPKNKVTTASGLQYEILKQGTGNKAAGGQEVVFHETLRYPGGTPLYDTKKTGTPVRILIGGNQAIAGLDEGIRGMQPGELRKLTVPPALSKRSTYPSFIAPDSTLIYEVELIEIK